MGIEDEINKSTIRVSFGRENKIEDVSILVESIGEILNE